jgi:hypothetical protein
MIHWWFIDKDGQVFGQGTQKACLYFKISLCKYVK